MPVYFSDYISVRMTVPLIRYVCTPRMTKSRATFLVHVMFKTMNVERKEISKEKQIIYTHIWRSVYMNMTFHFAFVIISSENIRLYHVIYMEGCRACSSYIYKVIVLYKLYIWCVLFCVVVLWVGWFRMNSHVICVWEIIHRNKSDDSIHYQT